MLARAPAGELVDLLRAKRALIALAAIIVAMAAMVMAVWPSFWPVMLAQVANGVADAVFPTAVAAISLGIVGRAHFTARVGRNEAFNHAVLPLRGVLYMLVRDPIGLVAIQVLDGVGAGIFGALFPVVVADVTEGSGRYNLAQGISAMAWGMGAALSNGVAGYVVEWVGYDAAFLFLAGCAVLALLVLWLMVPETRDWTRYAAKRHSASAATAQSSVG